MQKSDIIYIREKYKGKPMIVLCDNDHNFFVDCAGQCTPVWDDEKEIVSFVQRNIETSQSAVDFPGVITYTPYEFIQYIKILADKQDIINYFNEVKSKIGEDKYNYNLEILSSSFRHNNPMQPRSYYNK